MGFCDDTSKSSSLLELLPDPDKDEVKLLLAVEDMFPNGTGKFVNAMNVNVGQYCNLK